MFDDSVIVSGANLSSDYFTNRLATSKIGTETGFIIIAAKLVLGHVD